jgi:hypothetical protein
MGDPTLPEEPRLYHLSVKPAEGPAQDDVVVLLRGVADALELLGAVDVHDITYHVDSNDVGSWPSMTVYYEVEDGETHLVEDAQPDDERVTTEITLSESVFALDHHADAREVIDVAAAETAERGEAAVDITTGEATDADTKSERANGEVPAPVSAAPDQPARENDDVLPSGPKVWTTPAARPQPTARATPPADRVPADPSFPERLPSPNDRPALRRLKELLSRRR